MGPPPLRRPRCSGCDCGYGTECAPSKRLRVGLIAPPWVPVPPTVYGGTEVVVDQLGAGFDGAGCEVRAVHDRGLHVRRRSAGGGTHALGTVAEVSAELAHVEQAYRELADMDVIHDHTLTGPTWAAEPPPGVPVVTTAHGQFTPECAS